MVLVDLLLARELLAKTLTPSKWVLVVQALQLFAHQAAKAQHHHLLVRLVAVAAVVATILAIPYPVKMVPQVAVVVTAQALAVQLFQAKATLVAVRLLARTVAAAEALAVSEETDQALQVVLVGQLRPTITQVQAFHIPAVAAVAALALVVRLEQMQATVAPTPPERMQLQIVAVAAAVVVVQEWVARAARVE